ncbi:uncharacterized protein F4812DRAFT_417384 [Daldinia caldariorum]|uniref:uncharacterized protein n=1 Tax=Daldinia caldariorum TaxID=326644 RepID=UPI00200811FC|nr:uncharacterized protein F4812DRAFT_417384 [Daldinia caldariorum]KAI1470409.1 hypothetical protein F4812DRAFT_417384 [Daldinia caldariorum]
MIFNIRHLLTLSYITPTCQASNFTSFKDELGIWRASELVTLVNPYPHSLKTWTIIVSVINHNPSKAFKQIKSRQLTSHNSILF